VNIFHCDWKYFYEIAKDENVRKQLEIGLEIEKRLKMKKGSAMMLLEYIQEWRQ